MPSRAAHPKSDSRRNFLRQAIGDFPQRSLLDFAAYFIRDLLNFRVAPICIVATLFFARHRNIPLTMELALDRIEEFANDDGDPL